MEREVVWKVARLHSFPVRCVDHLSSEIGFMKIWVLSWWAHGWSTLRYGWFCASDGKNLCRSNERWGRAKTYLHFFYERTEETNVIHHTLQVYLTMIVMLSGVSGNGCTVSVMRKNDSRARREPESCLCMILAWVIADCWRIILFTLSEIEQNPFTSAWTQKQHICTTLWA
jgi:hypothetical protein